MQEGLYPREDERCPCWRFTSKYLVSCQILLGCEQGIYSLNIALYPNGWLERAFTVQEPVHVAMGGTRFEQRCHGSIVATMIEQNPFSQNHFREGTQNCPWMSRNGGQKSFSNAQLRGVLHSWVYLAMNYKMHSCHFTVPSGKLAALKE